MAVKEEQIVQNGKTLKSDPFSLDLRNCYRSLYLDYKTMLRREEMNYNKRLKDKLLNLEGNDPQALLKLVKKCNTSDPNEGENTK